MPHIVFSFFFLSFPFLPVFLSVFLFCFVVWYCNFYSFVVVFEELSSVIFVRDFVSLVSSALSFFILRGGTLGLFGYTFGRNRGGVGGIEMEGWKGGRKGGREES